MENRRGKTYITRSNCSLCTRTAATKQKRASKAAIYYIQLCFNNKGNLLCTSAEPQQRRNGRSRPSSLQMDAECLRVTVNYSLNTAFSKARAPSGVILTTPPSCLRRWVGSLLWDYKVDSQSSKKNTSFTLHTPKSVLEQITDDLVFVATPPLVHVTRRVPTNGISQKAKTHDDFLQFFDCLKKLWLSNKRCKMIKAGEWKRQEKNCERVS